MLAYRDQHVKECEKAKIRKCYHLYICSKDSANVKGGEVVILLVRGDTDSAGNEDGCEIKYAI